MKIKIKIGSLNASYYGVSIDSIIEEDFEKYVAAVVASEIGNAPLEACKAQAVASRSFAYRYILKDKPIPDSSSAQVYKAVRYSSAYQICIKATEETKGQILTYMGSVADTYFCHSNGGHTVSSKEKWGGERVYLPSKSDPYDNGQKSGHGVGLSQTGAKNQAITYSLKYRDILSFYYPGTAITILEEKEEPETMISLAKFLNGCKRNAARIKGYKLGHNGSNGLSDCIGYPIGALELEGQAWNGTHGSNYAARKRTNNLHQVSNASQLKLGELVYKAYNPGEKKYDASAVAKYSSTSNDKHDYYHVGVVTSVNPLEISHCSGGGMHYDKTLGKWKYAGYCSLVDYGNGTVPVVVPNEQTASDVAVTEPGKAIVDVPDDTTVNIRSAMSTSSKVIVKANEGTELDVLSIHGPWAKVNYSFNKVGTGYVMSKFISSGSLIDVPNDTTVNVREKASINSNKLTTLPEGNKVKVLSTTKEWSKIEYSEPKIGTGYVMSKYLKKG